MRQRVLAAVPCERARYEDGQPIAPGRARSPAAGAEMKNLLHLAQTSEQPTHRRSRDAGRDPLPAPGVRVHLVRGRVRGALEYAARPAGAGMVEPRDTVRSEPRSFDPGVAARTSR